eukprot:GILJ01004280.1.p1 GENE.GILJ01004280.1~~GILJ01004280.1.p1  ORF type:complete len:706 (-),score=106.77 GILJ01004280.1:99-2183(-)
MSQTATDTLTSASLSSPLPERRVGKLAVLARGLPSELPPMPEVDTTVPHAPNRTPNLSEEEFKLAVQNALRYFPVEWHEVLAPEFAEELQTRGHIWMKRFRPTEYEMRAYHIDEYPVRCRQAAAIMLMIMNNLDSRVAQYPHELVTYGGNGSVYQNWAQYLLVMKYLSEMTDSQTLVISSGHPVGLFPSHPDAPRVVLSNGQMIPNYSSKELYEKFFALGVTMYGQMTAGSYCYIGPQGIVHGTTLTVLNASRKYLGTANMSGKVLVTSGLGGMSGAQPKAGVICGCITVVAEVDESALVKRHTQGWVKEVTRTLDDCIQRIKEARANKEITSIAYLGNIVSLWERLAEEPELLVELGSDQTSLHNPFNGGYYPVQLEFNEAQQVMVQDPPRFKQLVQESLRRHVSAINRLVNRGMHFWDYGNSFLLEASRAGADCMAANGRDFRYPSYVEHIMGDIFSLGFGPFRWVCTSGDPEDLKKTDRIARDVIVELMQESPELVQQQYQDNLTWIEQADENQLVVGSQARILYSDTQGRVKIAQQFNKAVKEGRISAPVVLSRDHHDVSGTDSPYRETSNVTDGSKFTADMAVQNFVGDSFRGATWVSLHNGGGVGWGEVINGGFGLVLDGSDDAHRRATLMLGWDVNNGVARRAWGCNANAEFNIRRQMQLDPNLRVTLPNHAESSLLDSVTSRFCKK